MAPNSWLHMQSAPGGQLNCIAPDLGRDNCSIFPSCPSSGGSYDSDATVSKFLHRPCADPHVSPVQLPPLCDEVDSDDELFADENTATPDPAAGESVQQPVDEEYSDEDEQQSSPPATRGLDILSSTAGLKQAIHSPGVPSLLVIACNTNRALTDTNETKLHQRISLPSQSVSFPPHFAFADFTLQVLRPDPRALPLRLPTTRSPAPALPPRPTARLATGPSVRTVPIKCPACPAKKDPIRAGSMGQHLLTHAAEREVTWTPSVWCKLCDCESTDMCAFVEHFRACQVPFTPLQHSLDIQYIPRIFNTELQSQSKHQLNPLVILRMQPTASSSSTPSSSSGPHGSGSSSSLAGDIPRVGKKVFFWMHLSVNRGAKIRPRRSTAVAEHARTRLAPLAAPDLAAHRDKRGRGYRRGRRQQHQRCSVSLYKID
ncbi:hypothetical protein C8R44DRAFT_746737 [Mycena epipterygia]|nr:hypothetical protein C8R44DRAFT_746737 [Mycena epipterygia]